MEDAAEALLCEELYGTRPKKRRGARHTGEAKKAFLEEIYGHEANVEFNDKTGQAKIDGESLYLTSPTKELTFRHQLVADLAATGMKPTEIGRQLATTKNGEKTISQVGNHYSKLLRDPRIKARAQAQVQDALVEAQANLKSSVVKASENICNAIHAGDLKMSQYVLGTQGITDKKDTAGPSEVNINFGAWLSGGDGNTKDMHQIPAGEIDITNDVKELPSPEKGERL